MPAAASGTDRVLDRADQLLALGRREQAEALAAEVLCAEPDSVRALLVLGQSALLVGNLSEALRLARLVAASAPDDPRGWLLLARARLRNHESPPAYAVQAAEAAVRLAPHDPPCLHVLAVAAFRAGRHDLAEPAAGNLEATAPDLPLTLRTRGQVELATGRTAAARSAFQGALAITPDDPELLSLLGATEERALRPRAARRAQRAALGANPADRAAAAALRGDATRTGTESLASWWLSRVPGWLWAGLLVLGVVAGLAALVVTYPAAGVPAATAAAVGGGNVLARRR